jgi:hypothetical protein
LKNWKKFTKCLREAVQADENTVLDINVEHELKQLFEGLQSLLASAKDLPQEIFAVVSRIFVSNDESKSLSGFEIFVKTADFTNQLKALEHIIAQFGGEHVHPSFGAPDQPQY